MNLFIIGDVHGCLKTFKTLLQQWNPNTEILVQLGDLIDRGNFVPETIQFARELQKKYNNVIFLKGNHEALAVDHFTNGTGDWYERFGKKVLWQYLLSERNFDPDLEWFKTLPLFWENEKVFISHAGINHSPYCMDETHRSGLLWTREELKNIGKTQVIGHTPIKKVTYTEISQSWNIDTGAYLGKKLSGIKLSPTGQHLETIEIKTISSDIS